MTRVRLPQIIRKKVTVVGDGNCGKTCLLMVGCGIDFTEEYQPTIFENREITIAVDKSGSTDAVNGVIRPSSAGARGGDEGQSTTNVTLTLWDTAGQEDYERLRPLSYPDTDVAVICYAANARSSFENVIDRWHAEVRHYCGDIPIMLVACKCDLVPPAEEQERLAAAAAAASGSSHDGNAGGLVASVRDSGAEGAAPEFVSSSEGQSVAIKLGADFFETSARTGDGVKELFDELAKIALGFSLSAHDSGLSLADGSVKKRPLRQRICHVM